MITSKLYTSAFFLFFSVYVYSQNSISGIVIDSLNNPLNYASVAIFKNDTLIKGSVTDKLGSFKLQNLISGVYLLKIDYVGYSSYKFRINLSNDIDLGKIPLGEIKQTIEEVYIQGKTTNTKSEVDGIVYQVSAKEKRNASNTYQILTVIPELQVNTLQKTVSVNGSENTLILINNVKRDNIDLLSIDPKEIEYIEVVSNPSSKYLSRDITSVINIVTKEKTIGYKGNVSELTTPNLYTDNWTKYNLTFNKKNFSIYSTGFLSFLNENRSKYNLFNESSNDENIITKNTKSVFNKFDMVSGNIKSGVDINLGKNNYILFDMNFGGYSSNGNGLYNGVYLNNNIFQNDFQVNKKDGRHEIKKEYSLYYQNKQDNGALFSLDGNCNTYIDNYKLFYDEESPNSIYLNDLKSTSLKKSYDLQTNYSRNIGDLKGDIGYRIYYQDVEQKLTNLIVNDSVSDLQYKELKNYFYLNLKGKTNEKLSYQAGIGLEYTNINIRDIKTDTISNYYLKVLPTVGLQYKLNTKSNLNLNFVTSLERPQISSLNPAVRHVDSLKIQTGNPYLEPYFRYRLNLKYIFSYEKLYICPSITYTCSPNNIVSIGQTDDKGVYRVTFKNISKYNNYETALSFNNQFLNSFKLNTNVFYRYTKYNDNYNFINSSLSTIGYSISANYDYKDFSFYFAFNRQPKYLAGKTKGRSGDDSRLSVFWNLNDSWNIGASIRYLTLWEGSYVIDDKNYYESSETIKQDRYFRFLVELTYSFDKGKKKEKKEKKIHNTDNSEGLAL